MKIEPINTPAAGTWPRDCELISLSYCKGFKLSYHKDEEDTYWNIKCEGFVAYRLINEEFSRKGYLINLPVEGSFYEISDSPWISVFKQNKAEILNKCKHYVFRFYDETIEIIAQKCFFEKLNEKPIIKI
jgi:hypothetical protein